MFSQRAKFENAFDDNSDYSDNDEEQPQVVVVKSGDLTADEAELERQRLELGKKTLAQIVLFMRYSLQTFVLFRLHRAAQKTTLNRLI